VEAWYRPLRPHDLFHAGWWVDSSSSYCVDAKQLFRVWLGVTEYLFRNEDLLDEAIKTAIDDNTFRSDDLEFTFAARVSNKVFSISGYLYEFIS
jgi:prephenate dehydrogenase (NADP+)